jgi:hypothetical protein
MVFFLFFWEDIVDSQAAEDDDSIWLCVSAILSGQVRSTKTKVDFIGTEFLRASCSSHTVPS